MNPRLKNIILNKLNEDLSTAEIILAENHSIWFIDRANKYWYFELEKSGKLWWRYEFFTDFFTIFCLQVDEFQPILSEWVEGVLNCGVITSLWRDGLLFIPVEGVLNHGYRKGSRKVEEVLSRKINEIDGGELFEDSKVVEQILEHKVYSILPANEQNELIQQILVNELIYEVESATPLDTPAYGSVEEVLKNS